MKSKPRTQRRRTSQILLAGSLSLSLTPVAYAVCTSAGSPPTYTCTGATGSLIGAGPAENGATATIEPGASLGLFWFSEVGQPLVTGNPDLGSSNVTVNVGSGSVFSGPMTNSGVTGDSYNVNIGDNVSLGRLVLRGNNGKLSIGTGTLSSAYGYSGGTNLFLSGSDISVDSDAKFIANGTNVAWQATLGVQASQYDSLAPERRVLHNGTFHFGANTEAENLIPGTRADSFFQAIPNLNGLYGVDDQQDFGTNLRVQVDDAKLLNRVGFNIVGVDNATAGGPLLNVDKLTADVSDAGLVVIDTKNSRFTFGKNGGKVNVMQTGTATPTLYSGLVSVGGFTNMNVSPSTTYRGVTATPVLENNIFDINGTWTTEALADYYIVGAGNTKTGDTNTFNFGEYDAASVFSAASGTAVFGGAGAETVNLLGGTMTGGVVLGDGDDTTHISGGTLKGNVEMGDGNDSFVMDGGKFVGTFNGGAGNDTALFSAVDTSTIPSIDGGAGDNTLTLSTIARSGGADLTNWNTVNLQHGTSLTLTSNLALAGTTGVQTLNIDPLSSLAVTGERAITGSNALTVNNAGHIDLSGVSPAVNDRLVIGGDYVGNQGHVVLDTALAGTGSPTDRLLINGNASGTTMLHINNVGGAGAATGVNSTDGISVVQVAGASAPGSFALAGGYVAAGPYQYILRAFAPDASTASERDPLLGGSGDFSDFRLQSLTAGVQTPVPQIGIYQAALPSMVMMGSQLIDTMHHRLGEIRHVTGKASAWDKQVFARVKASELKFDGKKGPDFRQENTLLQIGATPFRHTDASGAELHAGVGLAYSESAVKVPSTSARGDITMPTVSGLISYLHPSGWYVDGVLQASTIRAKYRTAARGDVGKTTGYGLGASIEGGYNIQLPGNVRIEPQAQLQYQYHHLKGFSDVDQINVGKVGGSALLGRLGARLMLDSTDGAGRTFTPYVEANVIRQLAGSKNTVNAAGVEFTGDKMGTMAQYGVGVSAQWDKNVSMYVQARYTHEIGSSGYSGWGGTMGVRANF